MMHYFLSSQKTIDFFTSDFFFPVSCARSKKMRWSSRSDSSEVVFEVSGRDFFFLPLRAAWGLFPHSGGWPAWCVSWVWPPVPCSNGQNLQNQHAQLDKVGRIIHPPLVWAPLERGRGLELIVALHQHLFFATFRLLAFALCALTMNYSLMPK